MTGFVYLIRCGEFVKVGFSATPKRRLRYLVTGSPYDLELVATHAGTVQDEAALHRLLAAHHHRGEWFRSCPQIDQIIQGGLPSALHVATPRRQANSGRLLQWMTEHGVDDAAFADMIGGCTAHAVKKWKYGERQPPADRAMRIEDVTCGEVALRDLVLSEAA